MSRTCAIKKISIDVFPALLSTLKRICDVISGDVIIYLNNKNLFNRPKLKKSKTIRFLAALSSLHHYSHNSQSSSKKTEEKKSRGLILEEQHGSGGEVKFL